MKNIMSRKKVTTLLRSQTPKSVPLVLVSMLVDKLGVLSYQSYPYVIVSLVRARYPTGSRTARGTREVGPWGKGRLGNAWQRTLDWVWAGGPRHVRWTLRTCLIVMGEGEGFVGPIAQRKQR